MAATPRQQLRFFGTDGPTNDFAQFGSQAASAPQKTKDIVTIQSLSAWLNGLQDSVFGGNNAPYLEDMNSLFYVAFYQLVYLFEKGIPEWGTDQTYFTNSVVRKAGNGSFQLFASLTDSNTGNALPSSGNNTNWQQIYPVQASTISGTLTAAQIATLTAAQITGQLVDAQIASMSSSKLIGLITDAQIQAMAAAKLTGQIVNAQIASVDISKVTGTITVSDGAITRAKLATATGYISGPGGVGVNVTMQDYTFFPSILTHVAQDALITFPSTDLGDTIGRFGKGASQAYDIRWRYITASDNPRIWAMIEKDGTIQHVWEAEDPPNHEEMAEGEEELCPFTATDETEKAGLSIVQIPIPDEVDIHKIIDKLSDPISAAVHSRYKKKIRSKEWVSPHTIESMHPLEITLAVPKEKGPMARQWLFRSIAGKSNVARFIREIATYSHADKRMVFNKNAAAKIGPRGFQP